MLEEIRISNFAIIDRLELDFGKGLNVITGETGAGKSIIIDAVELLLGGKAEASMVRSGAEKAVIEGEFGLTPEAEELITPVLEREGLVEDDSKADLLILSREIRANGRTSARVNGVTVKPVPAVAATCASTASTRATRSSNAKPWASAWAAQASSLSNRTNGFG